MGCLQGYVGGYTAILSNHIRSEKAKKGAIGFYIYIYDVYVYINTCVYIYICMV